MGGGALWQPEVKSEFRHKSLLGLFVTTSDTKSVDKILFFFCQAQRINAKCRNRTQGSSFCVSVAGGGLGVGVGDCVENKRREY